MKTKLQNSNIADAYYQSLFGGVPFHRNAFSSKQLFIEYALGVPFHRTYIKGAVHQKI